MNGFLAIARKEFEDGLRNRWVLTSILLLGGLALVVAGVGTAPVGTVAGTTLATTVASLASLSVYLVPLIALMLSHDAIVGEYERGTLLLLLSYPVTRAQIQFGKFAGHLAILALALTLGYGAAGAVLALTTETSTEDFVSLARLVLTSVLLGAVFLSLGYAVSAFVRERASGIGAAFGIWLVVVVLYDLALIGILVADTNGVVDAGLLSALMLVNPADSFRIANLAALDSSYVGLGTTAMANASAAWIATGALAAWVVVSAAVAFGLFRRYEL
jgi:Cu-processing system permease protein